MDIDIIQLIDERFDSMSKGHKAVANYIRESYDSAVFMSAAKIGQEIGVSESTVVRFASALGFDGFPEFQSALAAFTKEQMNHGNTTATTATNNSANSIVDYVLKTDMEKINSALSTINPDAFETAVEEILNARKVYIFGIRSCAPLAQLMSFYLNIIRDDVICLTTNSSSETFEQMMRINEEDAFIGISFPRYSMRTLKTMEFATDRNAKTISITDSEHSPMCMYSTINLFAECNMVSIVDSLTAPLSLVNALVVALCMKAPEKVQETLSNMENIWSDYQVYLNDEINYISDEVMEDTE